MKYAKIFVPLLIILGVLFFLFEKRDKKDEPGVFGSLGEYYFVDSNAVDRIELEKDDTLISISRSGDQWSIENPASYLANADVVKDLLRSILENPVHRILPLSEVQDLSEYGLDSPTESLTLYSGGNVLVEIMVGDDSITGGDFYVQKKGGNEIMLTAVQLREKLIHDLDYYRSKNPLQFNEISIVRIDFTYPDSQLSLERNVQSRGWFITKPIQFMAQNPKVERFLTQLRRMEVVKFLNQRLEGEESHGLNKPVVKLELTDDKNSKIEMFIGDVDVASNGYYARFSNFPNEDFLVEASVFAKLKVNVDSFKETSLFLCDPPQILSIDVRLPGADNLSIYQDKSGRWKRLKPTSGDVTNDELNRFFDQLHGFRPDKYITEKELASIGDEVLGFTNYSLKIEIKAKEGCGDLDITVGNQTEDKRYFIKVSDIKEGGYIIKSEIIDSFMKVNESLRSGEG